MKEIIRLIENANTEVVVLEDCILCSSFGGRILGLFPDGEKNLFWVTDELFADSKKFFEGNGWRNIGGDRTWISPEISFHGDPNDWQSYSIQEMIDPGEYKVVSSAGNSVTMTSEVMAVYRNTNEIIPLRIEKEIITTDSFPGLSSEKIQAAGYELKTTISTKINLPEYVHPGIWNILQVPGGGKVISPTKEFVEPRRFIGEPYFEVYDNRIEIQGFADKSFKCGIHMNNISNVMMYTKSLNDGRKSLVVRTFEADPGGKYFDVPADEPSATGFIEQFYVDDGNLGGYVELEYHSPGLTASQSRLVNRSKVLGFIGDAVDINAKILEYFDKRE